MTESLESARQELVGIIIQAFGVEQWGAIRNEKACNSSTPPFANKVDRGRTHFSENDPRVAEAFDDMDPAAKLFWLPDYLLNSLAEPFYQRHLVDFLLLELGEPSARVFGLDDLQQIRAIEKYCDYLISTILDLPSELRPFTEVSIATLSSLKSKCLLHFRRAGANGTTTDE
ncbi:MAG: hypothetical protein WCK51_01560 [Armatimonadota bacterium]